MKADPNAIYRVVPPEKSIFTNGEIFRIIGHTFPTDRRDDHLPHGEWYCTNSECVVRQVEIRCKLYGEQMPAKMKCPACGSVLKFHHWIESESLLPVEQEQP